MRVLFGSTSAVGHVQPVLPLALAMQERGHELLWATAHDGCEWVRAAGLEATEVGLSARERMAQFEQRWPEAAALRGEDRVRQMFPKMFGAVTATEAFGQLLEVGHSWKPDVVVSEAADLASPVVAAAIGVPQVTHGFGLVVPGERVAEAAEWTVPLWERVGLAPRPYGGLYDHLYIDIYPPSLQPEDLSHVGRIQRRRPQSLTSAPMTDAGAVAEVRRLVDDPRPLVYLTFGTVFNVNPTFQSAVDALGRIDEVVAVVTVGPDGDTETFGQQPDNVAVLRYVSQDEVLPHCAAVVSHVGSGTLLGSLSLGIPQVCLPQAADQLRNAAACSGAGAGIALFGEEATSAAIEAALRQVLTEPAFAASARRIADEISAMPSVEVAAETVERLVGEELS